MLHAALRRGPMKAIAVAVAIFVLLDSSVLAINLWISRELDETSIEINLAGRQRMLSQRMTKAALQTVSAADGRRLANAEVELFEAARLFDETLQGFAEGGQITAGDGRRVALRPIDDPVALELLAQARAVWRPIMATVRLLGLEGAPAPRRRIADDLGAHEGELLDLMNRLTSRIEAVSLGRTQVLRGVQTGAFTLAVLNFVLVILLLLARYRAAARRGQQLEGMIDHIAAGVCLLDRDNRLIAANPAAIRILGRSVEALRGHRLSDYLDEREGVWGGCRPDGNPFHVALNHGTVGTESGPVGVVTLLDLSERIDAESRLRRLALHDALTGLPNRRMLDDRLKMALAQAQRGQHKVGVAMVDLDGFKPINDEYGHAAGDCVLQAVAQRLTTCARAGDTVARLGGDEFVCVFSTLRDRGELDVLGERMLETLTQPLQVDEHRIPLSASIGLALSPDNGSEPRELLRAADHAMYRAKQAGGRRIDHVA